MDKDAHIQYYSIAWTPLWQVFTLYALFLSALHTLICTCIQDSISFYFLVLVLASLYIYSKEKDHVEILCSHLLTSIAWGQYLFKDWLKLWCGRKSCSWQQAERHCEGSVGFTIKDFKPKPL